MKKETILKFYQNYRLYIFPLITALSSLILIIFVIYPQTMNLITNHSLEKEILNKSTFLEAKAQALEDLDSEDLTQKVDLALSAYPTDKDFGAAFGGLQNLIAKIGFSITSISLGSSSQMSGDAQSYGLKLDILGPNSQLPLLLDHIDNFPRLMRVGSFETSVGSGSEGATISVNVSVLYSPAPEGFGSVDSPLPELSDQDEEVLARLARVGALPQLPAITQPGARGKPNPFE